MIFKSIRLIGFRSYDDVSLDFSNGINLLTGPNARGKTNLMEAIAYAVCLNSFRTRRDSELINFKRNDAYIGALVEESSLEKFVEVKLQRGKKKRVRLNKCELSSFREFDLKEAVVSFIPEDLDIVKGSPEKRRNFLDGIISRIFPIYRYNINSLNRILFERNKLLKSNFKESDKRILLDAYDAQLAKTGEQVFRERIKMVGALREKLSGIYGGISDDCECINIRLLSDLSLDGDYLDQLKNAREEDLIRKFTSRGPHRDDIQVSLDCMDSRVFASQGQQRSLVLALKLSELEITEEFLGESPILILDDVFSELDDSRKMNLMKSFKGRQVFISSTEKLKEVEVDREYSIEKESVKLII